MALLSIECQRCYGEETVAACAGRGKYPNEIPAGVEVRIDGADLLVMQEADIMGIVEKTGASTIKAA